LHEAWTAGAISTPAISATDRAAPARPTSRADLSNSSTFSGDVVSRR